MLENWAAIIGANTLILAILGFLARSIIKHWLDKDVASFKNELTIDSLKFQISYGGIFSSQSAKLLEIYEAIVDLEDVQYYAVHSGEEESQRKIAFIESWRKLRRLYLKSRILLPENIDNLLKKYTEDVLFAVTTYIDADGRFKRTYDDNALEDLSSKMSAAMERQSAIANDLKEELVVSMRKVIGVLGK